MWPASFMVPIGINYQLHYRQQKLFLTISYDHSTITTDISIKKIPKSMEILEDSFNRGKEMRYIIIQTLGAERYLIFLSFGNCKEWHCGIEAQNAVWTIRREEKGLGLSSI